MRFVSLSIVAWALAFQILGQCDAPEYFGICDPYVPGVFLGRLGRVLDTWPNGPAEKAGLCPGDTIVGVNGARFCKGCQEQLLRAVVQTLPQPLTLSIERGDRRFDVTVVPVRESDLAAASGRTFVRQRVVPKGQALAGLSRVDEFCRLSGSRVGMKRVDEALWLPADFPEAEIPKLCAAMKDLGRTRRIRALVAAYQTADDYSAGLSIALLNEPPEAVVIQVLPKSPAHQAGARPGDRVLTLNGIDPATAAEDHIRSLLFSRELQLNVTIGRGTERLLLTFRPERATSFHASDVDPISGTPRSLSVIPDYGESRQEDSLIVGLHLLYDEARKAAVVVDLDYPSPAFDAGAQIGDLVFALNDKPLNRLPENKIRNAVSPASRSPILLTVQRGDETRGFVLTPERYASTLSRIGRTLTPLGMLTGRCCESLRANPRQ